MRNIRKRVVLLAVMTGVLFAFTGCKEQEKKATESVGAAKTKATMIITEDNQIQVVYKESFDKEHYKEEELKAAVEQELKDFNTEVAAEAVSLEALVVADGNAELKLVFMDGDMYSKYINDYVNEKGDSKVFVGNGVEAKGSTNCIPTEAKDKDGNSIGRQDMELTENDVVVCINEEQKIYIDGTCKYYTESVKIEDGLAITKAGENNYIVYEKK